MAAQILFLADEPDKGLWDFFEKDKLEGVEMIISCGDLPANYLSFLATFFKGPVYYIHGNHDEHYEKNPPEGCICIEDRVIEYDGIRIAGLGGSMEYRGGIYQYTEKTMSKRVRKLKHKISRMGGVDIFVAHSPAAGMNDGEDLPHRGFQCFYDIIDDCKPKYFVHGHVHISYSYKQPRMDERGETVVVNAFQKYSIPADSIDSYLGD